MKSPTSPPLPPSAARSRVIDAIYSLSEHEIEKLAHALRLKEKEVLLAFFQKEPIP